MFVQYLNLQTWALQGKGYATEAAIAVRDYAVSVGVNQLIAYIEKENKPSIRISEKIGMHC